METPTDERNVEPFRQWLNRQIWILVAVILIVANSELTERQDRKQEGSSTAITGEMQPSDPVETGAIPSNVLEEPWMKEYGHD